MNKIIFLLVPLGLVAQSFLFSNIPLPQSYVQDLDPYSCNEQCKQEYLDTGMIFSFLAKAQASLENSEQETIRLTHLSIFSIPQEIKKKKLKIAMLLPYKHIGKYSLSTMKATFAYLITKNYPFELKSYKVENEDIETLYDTLEKIQDDGFNYIIAPLTKYGAQNIIDLNPALNIYFPTINKSNVDSNSSFLYFGAIDYKAQSDILLEEAVSPLVIFYDHSSVSQKLTSYEEEVFLDKENNETEEYNKVIKYKISTKKTNLEHYLKKNKKIDFASFFLNTPIVKSGMIMSQLTLYDTNITNILSTQVNYDPLILSMTQYTDRKKLIIANSITQKDKALIETNTLLNNDIEYDWINYTTTIGVDYFFDLMTGNGRKYNIYMKDNQMNYEIELIQPSLSNFKKYSISQENIE